MLSQKLSKTIGELRLKVYETDFYPISTSRRIDLKFSVHCVSMVSGHTRASPYPIELSCYYSMKVSINTQNQGQICQLVLTKENFNFSNAATYFVLISLKRRTLANTSLAQHLQKGQRNRLPDWNPLLQYFL